MPVIHTHVSVPTTPEQREALKAAYGKAITAVPGKSEARAQALHELLQSATPESASAHA